ncbi:hypothetical protein [Pseudoalteromonas sp. M8]|uniref:hypothetical protein n=1 Tax=Pseudoalteromonas sp. M8 TaxID=2692624 RepID=UPI002013BF14|nr:hypothetical protein [Pseudoalteromonas sp. M8]
MQTKAHQSTALALMLSLLYFSPNAAAKAERDNIERISVVGQPIKRNSGPTGLDLTIKETPSLLPC